MFRMIFTLIFLPFIIIIKILELVLSPVIAILKIIGLIDIFK